VVRLVGTPPAPVDHHPRGSLPEVLEPPHAGRPPERPLNRDAAIKRWVAHEYGIALDHIDRVVFDVQLAAVGGEDSLVLEIDVTTVDGIRHLFVRRICEFGAIVGQVLDLSA
jgi:hypothetical protein